VRVDVLTLVARCEPKFKKEVPMLAGNLSMLLAAYAGEVPGAQRRRAADPAERGSAADEEQARRHEALHAGAGRGPAAPDAARPHRPAEAPALHARPVRAGAPYTPDEVTRLVSAVDAGPARVRHTGLSALLLGLGYGIVVPDTKHVTGAGDNLAFKGQPLTNPPAQLPGALTQHRPLLEPLTTGDWKGLRAWLQWEHPNLELTAQRLKDTWLSQRSADAVTPVVTLMSENGVGRLRLVRVAAEAVLDDDPRLRLLLEF
jgi:hypothetical protein